MSATRDGAFLLSALIRIHLSLPPSFFIRRNELRGRFDMDAPLYTLVTYIYTRCIPSRETKRANYLTATLKLNCLILMAMEVRLYVQQQQL